MRWDTTASVGLADVTSAPRADQDARLMDVLCTAFHPLRIVRCHPHHDAYGEGRAVGRWLPLLCFYQLDDCGHRIPCTLQPAACRGEKEH